METKSTPQRKVTVSTQGGGKEKKKGFRKHKMTKKKKKGGDEIRRLMHLVRVFLIVIYTYRLPLLNVQCIVEKKEHKERH